VDFNSTKGLITFNNMNVTFANSELIGDIEEQISRLSASDARRRIFRTDLMMLGEGDIRTTSSSLPSKDMMIVSGVLNYAQALLHRLMTTRGYHPADRSFGVPWDSYLGQSYRNKSIVEAQLSSDVAEEIGKDSRTASVIKVVCKFESPTVVSVVCDVAPVSVDDLVIQLSLSAGAQV